MASRTAPWFHHVVSTDLATLLAQVIPVIGLALGIELRALGTRIKAEREDGVEPTEAVTMLAMGAVMSAALAAGELLSIASLLGTEYGRKIGWGGSYLLGDDNKTLSVALTFAIVAAFIFPAGDGIRTALRTSTRLRQLSSFIFVILFIAPFAIMWFLAPSS